MRRFLFWEILNSSSERSSCTSQNYFAGMFLGGVVKLSKSLALQRTFLNDYMFSGKILIAEQPKIAKVQKEYMAAVSKTCLIKTILLLFILVSFI